MRSCCSPWTRTFLKGNVLNVQDDSCPVIISVLMTEINFLSYFPPSPSLLSLLPCDLQVPFLTFSIELPGAEGVSSWGEG